MGEISENSTKEQLRVMNQEWHFTLGVSVLERNAWEGYMYMRRAATFQLGPVHIAGHRRNAVLEGVNSWDSLVELQYFFDLHTDLRCEGESVRAHPTYGSLTNILCCH